MTPSECGGTTYGCKEVVSRGGSIKIGLATTWSVPQVNNNNMNCITGSRGHTFNSDTEGPRQYFDCDVDEDQLK